MLFDRVFRRSRQGKRELELVKNKARMRTGAYPEVHPYLIPISRIPKHRRMGPSVREPRAVAEANLS